MKRIFPLAGLLRLRHLQQDEAAVELAAANSRVNDNETRRDRARALVHGGGHSPTSVAAMSALAAARASSRSMLADLDALGQGHQAALAHAQTVFDAARAESVALEKLKARHSAAVIAADLKAEQTVLDEIASTRWHREHEADDDDAADDGGVR